MDPVNQVRKELQSKVDEKYKQGSGRFFKEDVKVYGVRVPEVRVIAKNFFKEIKDSQKTKIFGMCEELLKSGYIEEAFIAYFCSDCMKKRFEIEDFFVFEKWLNCYVSNWAECDTLCNHTMGSFIEKYPNYIENLKNWTKSNNRWMRRGAAVTLILPARKGKFLEDIFEIAESLLQDKDDLVQKGYGWLLKEASKKHQKQVFEYVLKNKDKMPRTALRYAIEKMPPQLRKQAMKK
ncbi:MAG: DNA alkylation repair protein [Candidatus Bathyarchaeota archaeon]|nr:DNA alkylation repair protein [Candidatus Bathyarchaeum tardum]WGM90690.1 MAG: DNA alkylation repair protein [Candidatus Bathyarchaeum tardum]WNZ30429.1 MAG: DNA alkylation repair protein [Candidatus Bathyarchaeota archaeon]